MNALEIILNPETREETKSKSKRKEFSLHAEQDFSVSEAAKEADLSSGGFEVADLSIPVAKVKPGVNPQS